jgi:hypothetical protein
MSLITNIDLRADANAAHYVKHEIVDVVFATEQGFLQSREGPNHHAAGDALITGSTGDRWSVTLARFRAKYTPIAGTHGFENGRYVNNPLPVLAVQILRDFSILRSQGGDLILGCCNMRLTITALLRQRNSQRFIDL